MVVLDDLERAYTRDSVSEAEYTDICSRLLKQYGSALSDERVRREFGDLEAFKREYDVSFLGGGVWKSWLGGGPLCLKEIRAAPFGG